MKMSVVMEMSLLTPLSRFYGVQEFCHNKNDFLGYFVERNKCTPNLSVLTIQYNVGFTLDETLRNKLFNIQLSK